MTTRLGRRKEVGMRKFNREEILEKMESLQQASGAFVAALTPDYGAVWIRDQLYTSWCYYYLRQPLKLLRGVHVIFDIMKKHRQKIAEFKGASKAGDYIHARYDPISFAEITEDWGHHQLDALGLFLFIVGTVAREGIPVIRDDEDVRIIALLIRYLEKVRYWETPDFGMWEEGPDRHASSICACARGLGAIFSAPDLLAHVNIDFYSLIEKGYKALDALLPNESPTRTHDLAQLSLLWPYKYAGQQSGAILQRIIGGPEPLVQKHGLNRYWGDDYYRSRNGVSAEWPLGFFWLSIVFAEQHDRSNANIWFQKGVEQIVDGRIPELYLNDSPGTHTPLAWAHSFSLIAHVKLQRLS